MADIRSCEQCGASFVPRREHARFCCVHCRITWNHEHMGDPTAEASALQWSVTAMSEVTGRLAGSRVWDLQRAFAAVGEAVWWVTIVDATLVRHHPAVYDAAMARAQRKRRVIEETLGGLRFVRNQIGHKAHIAEFVEPGRPGPGAGAGPITGWTWRPVRQPGLAPLSPRGQAWEMERYRAYQAQLAGHTVGEIFWRTVPFLELTAADAASIAPLTAHATR